MLAFTLLLAYALAQPGTPDLKPELTPQVDHEAALIPRSVLFGNPERLNPLLSPDGSHLSYLAPVDGVLNIWIAPVESPADARPLTHDKGRGIREHFWAYDNKHVLYPQDRGGDESWKIFSVEVATGSVRDLTPFDSVPAQDGNPILLPNGKMLRPSARIQLLSDKFPDEALIAINNRNAAFHDLHRVSVTTGHMVPVIENDQLATIVVDNSFKLRFAQTITDDGGASWTRFDPAVEEFVEWAAVPPADALTTRPIAFDKSGKTAYIAESRGRNTTAIQELDFAALSTGVSPAPKTVAEHPSADAGDLLFHPITGAVQAVSFNASRREWTIVDEAIRPDFEYLRSVSDGDMSIPSRSLDDSRWIVSFANDDGPTVSYLYDRTEGSRKTTLLFNHRPQLVGQPLAPMHAVEIESRDGLKLTSYLTLPSRADADGNARPDNGPIPMVLLVHGGPWARDSWGFNANHQWLADRGYAVLSVNFRGSTGFGKQFTNAGDREWAGAMHNDLLDAVAWAVDQKIALADKVAIMGASYGGYATLVGLTFTPEVFACGVDIVGPSNLNTLLETIPPDWAPRRKMFEARIGDPTSPSGRAFLTSRSPISKVEAIRRPLLIGQGANDPRVKQSESDQIVQAMQAKKIPVTYVLFPDEGHGFRRPENNMAFSAIVEAFLAQHLGGRAEPENNSIARSTANIVAGGEFLERGAEKSPSAGGQ